MMELGLGVLHLSPRDFWTSTPREIAAAFPSRGPVLMGRADLDHLMREFPDQHD
ncbi:MAG: phage tail assembly chaperone [Alphaproteobacteria bacterium]|nr:phage tail assembly chaperone [Alphaproteobacteria bacterium]